MDRWWLPGVSAIALFGCSSVGAHEPTTETREVRPAEASELSSALSVFAGETIAFSRPLDECIREVLVDARSARSSQELLTHWVFAMTVAERITSILSGRGFDGTVESFDAQINVIDSGIPWGQLSFYGEGMNPLFELQDSFWEGLAKALPDKKATDFFRLSTITYDNASFSGWSEIQQRTWDYGGCSPLGDGKKTHLQILQLVDRVQGDGALTKPVEKHVIKVRSHVMGDLVVEHEEFPYCQQEEKGGNQRIVDEVTEILHTVKLTKKERKQLEKQISTFKRAGSK